MQTGTLKLHSLELRDARAWLFAALFVAGNVLLPQVCHHFHLGGPRLLPIYFFTLVGAYKYGWRVGLVVATLSPAVNSLLFGMPAAAMVPVIMAKSALLALAAAFAAERFRKASLLLLVGVVAFYQFVGTLVEWAIVGDLGSAVQDFRLGLAGMALQVVGGWLIINFLIRK